MTNDSRSNRTHVIRQTVAKIDRADKMVDVLKRTEMKNRSERNKPTDIPPSTKQNQFLVVIHHRGTCLWTWVSAH